MIAARIEDGRLLRPLSKSGKVIADELGDWAIWSVVEQSAKEIAGSGCRCKRQSRTVKLLGSSIAFP
jgi:hypothetical protein